jgi:hypothetical protein
MLFISSLSSAMAIPLFSLDISIMYVLKLEAWLPMLN